MFVRGLVFFLVTGKARYRGNWKNTAFFQGITSNKPGEGFAHHAALLLHREDAFSLAGATNPLHDIFQKDDRAAGILLRRSIIHAGDRRYEYGPGKF